MTCDKCGNTMGFAFCTCVRCGWNEIDKSFHYIKVNVNDLPTNVKEYLINKHASNFK